MIRIISLNLNGIRSATRKGWLSWAEAADADLVCVQELKAQPGDLDDAMRAIPTRRGLLTGHFHCAQQKGYSGVGIYTLRPPDRIIEGLGVPEIDDEGRYLELMFGNLSVISVYLPSGSSGEHRQAAKFRFMDHFIGHLQALAGSGRQVVLCGDWNIAHREIDLKNWRSNQKNSGFLPEERAWIGRLFDEQRWIDVYRRLHPETTGDSYTWWSNRGQAWANNVGWRLDYQIATPALGALAEAAAVFKAQRFSDHAPLLADYRLQPDVVQWEAVAGGPTTPLATIAPGSAAPAGSDPATRR